MLEFNQMAIALNTAPKTEMFLCHLVFKNCTLTYGSFLCSLDNYCRAVILTIKSLKPGQLILLFITGTCQYALVREINTSKIVFS